MEEEKISANQETTTETETQQTPAENPQPTETQQSAQPPQEEQPKKKPGQVVMRSIVMTSIIVADVAFAATMGYLLVTMLMSVFGLDLGPVFGGALNTYTLGLWGVVGVFVYVAIGFAALVLIGLAIAFYATNKSYYNVLRYAKKNNMDIVLAPFQTFSYMLTLVLVIAVLIFVALFSASNSPYSVFSIMTYICCATTFAILVFTIIHSIINRIKFSKLEYEEQQKVREESRIFKRKVAKEERKSRIGRLY